MSLLLKPPSKRRRLRPASTPSHSQRDWKQIYFIYGLEQWRTLILLLLNAILCASLAFFFLRHFSPISVFLHSNVHFLSLSTIRFSTAILICLVAFSSVCFVFAAGNLAHSAVTLRYEMAQRMVGAVNDWSSVRTALDVGCGKGILLNAVATQLKKSGSPGRVVGLDRSKPVTLSTLKTADLEGVGEYVTCKEGDVRSLPFADDYFDVVVSAVFIHTAGREYGRNTVEAAAERMRVLGEIIRVLKPGGIGIVWDVMHVPEYVRRLKEMKMEGVTVSERVTAFLMRSHIVSFRKPKDCAYAMADVRLNWKF